MDVEETVTAYLEGAIQSFDVLLPTDHNDRVAAVMQYVEKRIARSGHNSIMRRVNCYAMGLGANSWSPVAIRERLRAAHRSIIPRPSELGELKSPKPALVAPPITLRGDSITALLCTVPRLESDVGFWLKR